MKKNIFKLLLVFIVIFSTVIGIWVYLNRNLYFSRASQDVVNFYLEAKAVNVSQGGAVEVNVFMETRVDSKVSGATVVLKYPHNILDYYFDLPEGQTGGKCSDTNPALTKRPRENVIKLDNENSIVYITRVSQEGDDKLPSGLFCFGTVVFRPKSSGQGKISLFDDFNLLNIKRPRWGNHWEAVGPDKTYEVRINQNKKEVDFNISADNNLSPTQSPTSAQNPTVTSSQQPPGVQGGGIFALNRWRRVNGREFNNYTELVNDYNVISERSSVLYTTIVRNLKVTGVDDKRQWSDIIIINPNQAETSIIIKAYDRNGNLAKTINKNIKPNGYYSTFADNDWLTLPDTDSSQEGNQFLGWAEITSNRPVAGLNRWRLTQGDRYNNNFDLMSDNPLITQRSSNLYIPMVLRNHNTPDLNKSQWTHNTIVNPNSSDTSISINVYDIQGNLVRTINKNIKANGLTSTQSDFLNLPDTDPRTDGVQFLGWAEVLLSSSTNPIVTQSPNPTSPPAGNTNLNLKIKLQGVNKKPINMFNSIKLKARIKQEGGNQVYDSEGIFNYQDGFVWSGKISFNIRDRSGNWILYLKGPKHIQRKICDPEPKEDNAGFYRCSQGKIVLSGIENNLDFSKITLFAGDVDQNGVTDSLDYSAVRNNLGKKDEDTIKKYDLNFDGIVNTQDFSLIIYALSVRPDDM